MQFPKNNSPQRTPLPPTEVQPRISKKRRCTQGPPKEFLKLWFCANCLQIWKENQKCDSINGVSENLAGSFANPESGRFLFLQPVLFCQNCYQFHKLLSQIIIIFNIYKNSSNWGDKSKSKWRCLFSTSCSLSGGSGLLWGRWEVPWFVDFEFLFRFNF